MNCGSNIAGPVDGHDGSYTRIKGRSSGSEITAQRVSPDANGLGIDIISCKQIVDNWRRDSLPVVDEADVLLAADSGLARSFVSNHVDAPGERALDGDMVQLLHIAVVAVAHDDSWTTARTSTAVEDGRHIKPLSLERDSLGRHGEQRKGFVKGGSVFGIGGVYARVLPVAMEVEFCAAEVRCLSEVGVPCGNGILARIDAFSLCVYADGEVVESSVVAFKVAWDDLCGGSEDFAHVGALVGREGDGAEDFEVEARVGA